MRERRGIHGFFGKIVGYAFATVANYWVCGAPIASLPEWSGVWTQRMKEELRRVIDELCTGELTPGRNLEQLHLDNSLYSVRLNRNFRFVFQVRENGVGAAIAVGSHNSAYEAAARARRQAKVTRQKKRHIPFPLKSCLFCTRGREDFAEERTFNKVAEIRSTQAMLGLPGRQV